MRHIRTTLLNGPNLWSIRSPKVAVVELEISSQESQQIVTEIDQANQFLSRYAEARGISLGTKLALRQKSSGAVSLVEDVAFLVQSEAGITVRPVTLRATAPVSNKCAVFEYSDSDAALTVASVAVELGSLLLCRNDSWTARLSEVVTMLRTLYPGPFIAVKSVSSSGDQPDPGLSRAHSGHKSILSVTGTNGKTSTARLLSHMVRATGRRVGIATTEGIHIDGMPPMPRDLKAALEVAVTHSDLTDRCLANVSGSEVRAARVLEDQRVDIAILEIARGAILRTGLPFESCDVGALLNIANDHLGSCGIETLDDMANLKSVLLETISPGGFAVLNADDVRVRKQGARLACKVAYFSLDPCNAFVTRELENGGVVAFLQDGKMKLRAEGKEHLLSRVSEVPITMEGRAPFMTQNALAASLMAYVSGVPLESIGLSLRCFMPSFQDNPGRMNLYRVGGVHALVDYAHNTHGLTAVREYVQKWNGKSKVGVISLGAFSGQDIRELGEICARTFSNVIVTINGEEQLKPQLAQFKESVEQKGIGPRVRSFRTEVDAIIHGLHGSESASLVVLLTTDISRATWFATRDYQE